MPANATHSAPLPTAADDSAELQHWLGIVRDAFERGAHVDLVILGESDGATVTCWSTSCPAADQKADFLRWLADTVADADAFFIPEDGQ